MFIQEAHRDDNRALLVKLPGPAHLYKLRMELLKGKQGGRMHMTRLKQRLLAHFRNRRGVPVV